MNPQDPNYQQPPHQLVSEQPQVYGQAGMPPVVQSQPNQPPQPAPQSSGMTKKLIWLVGGLLVLLMIVLIAALVFGGAKPGVQEEAQKFSHNYDSPIGLSPGMQSRAVTSGTFSLTASYVTGSSFTRSGSFAVHDGKLQFEMVSDDVTVNKLMQQLHERSGSKASFDRATHGVAKYMSFDFASILGYHYLYDDSNDGGGLIPAVEAAKKAPKPDDRFTLNSTCDTALQDVREKTDMRTTNLVFQTREDGVNKRKATIAFSTLQAIDTAVTGFLENCYDLSKTKNGSVKKRVDALKADVTKTPEFTFWQEGGKDIIEISAPEKDTPFGGGLHFELTDLQTGQNSEMKSASSYRLRRNQFGLAYSLCRVDPVVTTTQRAGYRFLREDPAYRYPRNDDSGYYCTTLTVPSQFSPPTQLGLRNATGAIVQISGTAIDSLRGFHDLTHEIEQFSLSNKRYPGPTEFRDLANSNVGSLTAATQAAFANNSLVYSPTPAACVGTCKDYVLSFVPVANVQLRRTTYQL